MIIIHFCDDNFDDWNIDQNIHHTTPFLDHSYCAEKLTKMTNFVCELNGKSNLSQHYGFTQSLIHIVNHISLHGRKNYCYATRPHSLKALN